MPPPFELRSSLYGVQNPSMKNWPTGKLSSISEIISMSALPLICSESNPNLFRIEFMFKWAKISLLRLSLRKDFKVLLQSLTLLMSCKTLALRPSIFILELLSATRQLKTLGISFTKVRLKIFESILFKWSLRLLRWFSFIFFEWSIM